MSTHRERGQSSVEFALILPIMLVLVLALAQVGLIVQAQISVTHTAREAARALAVDPAADVRAAAFRASNLSAPSTEVTARFAPASVSGRQIVEVTVSYRIPVISGLFAPLVEGEVVTARASMLIEGP